jgi:hypothetical protein
LITWNLSDSKRQQTTTVDYKRLFNGFVLVGFAILQQKTKRITMNTREYKTVDVPMGNTKEDIKARETIISDVYRCWYEANPTKAVYNSDLKDVINVRYLSITETMRHAAKSYLSTLAVLQLDLILKTPTKLVSQRQQKQESKTKANFQK